MSSASSDGASPSARQSLATLAVHAGMHPEPYSGAVAPPLMTSSIFVHGSPGGYEYARQGSPTWERLEASLAALEDASAATVFASGMATITAVVETVPWGAAVVGPDNGYTVSRQLLNELHAAGRVEARLVDIADTDSVRDACHGAALLCLESLTNPLLTVPDLAACIEAAHAAGALVMVDNTFATPCTLQPTTLGADIVMHSLSKYIGGHSDLVLGGAAVRDPEVAARLVAWRTMTGAIPGQLECWLALRGVRTIAVRMPRQMDNALQLARRLERHSAVERVRYPGLPSHPQHLRAAAQMQNGFGGMVSIDVRGGAARAEAVCQAVSLWTHSTSLGGVESTLERRARYPMDAEVVPYSLLRLSVGIEDVDDLYDDLDRALVATESLAARVQV